MRSEWEREKFNTTMAKDIQHPERHNFFAKVMGYKYLLCTYLQDAQRYHKTQDSSQILRHFCSVLSLVHKEING